MSRPEHTGDEKVNEEILIGKVRGGDRDGEVWIGSRSVDIIKGGLGDQPPVHAIVLGQRDDVRTVIELLEDELADE